MNRIAIPLAALTFFGMALLGLLMGQGLVVCMARSVVGAAVSYTAAFFSIRMMLGVMLKAVRGATGRLDSNGVEDHNDVAVSH